MATGKHEPPKGATNPKSDADVGIGSGEAILRSAKLLASAEPAHFTTNAHVWVVRARAVARAFLSTVSDKQLKKIEPVGITRPSEAGDEDHLTSEVLPDSNKEEIKSEVIKVFGGSDLKDKEFPE